MKSCLFSFFGIFWFIFVMFRPFNVIIFALFSLIMLFFEQEIYEIFSYVYFSISFFIFLCCIISILTSGISQKLSSIHRKYYLAINYTHGAEGFSFLCSTFALFNILWTIKMLYYGHWYFFIYTLLYYFLYNLFIGPRLNPFLFLGDRVKKGDINAYKELYIINSIKEDGPLSPFFLEKKIKKKNIFSYLKKMLCGYKMFSDFHKVTLFFSLFSITVLSLAVFDEFEYSFYTFLRWVVCGSICLLIYNKSNVYLSVLLIIGAIIYNPIAPIQFGDRDIWQIVNILTIPLIVAAEILSIWRILKNGTSEKR